MRGICIAACGLLIIFFSTVSCETVNNSLPEKKRSFTPQEILKKNVDSLKKSLQEGDLIVRLGDDFISDRIRFLSEKDPSYSHAGVVVIRNNEPMVCHIYPENLKEADTIKYQPVDTFIQPEKNIRCALFRYDFSEEERRSFIDEVNYYHKKRVTFDKVYDLESDSAVYCSEMIYKSLRRATHNRINCTITHLPKKMLSMVMMYFDIYRKPRKYFERLKIMSIDNLYLLPECSLVMAIPLKIMP